MEEVILEKYKEIAVLYIYIYHFLVRRNNCEKTNIASSWLAVSVRPSAWHNSVPTGRIFMKFDIFGNFFREAVEKIQTSLKTEKTAGYTT